MNPEKPQNPPEMDKLLAKARQEATIQKSPEASVETKTDSPPSMEDLMKGLQEELKAEVHTSPENKTVEKFDPTQVEKAAQEYFAEKEKEYELSLVDCSLDGGRYYAALKDNPDLFKKFADAKTENAMKNLGLEVERREKRLAGGFYREATDAAGLDSKYRDIEFKSDIERALVYARKELEEAQKGKGPHTDGRINDMSVAKSWLGNGLEITRENKPIKNPEQLLDGVNKVFKKDAQDMLKVYLREHRWEETGTALEKLSELPQIKFTEGVMSAALESGDAKTTAMSLATIESVRSLSPEELNKVKESLASMKPEQKKEFLASYETAKKDQPNFRTEFDRLNKEKWDFKPDKRNA